MGRRSMIRNRTVRGLCQCGNLQAYEGYNKHGEKIYRVLCSRCHKQGKRTKKPQCENCGFIALHPCQLDVDHIDGNKRNHVEENLQTLCANCHRLKTHANKEWSNQYGV